MPREVVLLGRDKVASCVHSRNALAPMPVTPTESVNVVSAVHRWNILSPRLTFVLLAENTTVVSKVHPLNASAPSVVTLLGIVTVVSAVHP